MFISDYTKQLYNSIVTFDIVYMIYLTVSHLVVTNDFNNYNDTTIVRY